MIVQVAPAATEAPQVLVSEKSVPATAIFAMLSELLPELASVTDCVDAVVPLRTVPKLREFGVSWTVSVAWTPLPDSETV